MNVTRSNAVAVDLIRRSEGCKYRSYRDGAGVWTIGVGHTGADVGVGMTCTDTDVERWLLADMADAIRTVDRSVKVPMNENQRAALISLCFNIGVGAFAKSLLVHRLNALDYLGAANEFLAWDKINGKVNYGLKDRRAKERALFLAPAPNETESRAPEVVSRPVPSTAIEPALAPVVDVIPGKMPNPPVQAADKPGSFWTWLAGIFRGRSG